MEANVKLPAPMRVGVRVGVAALGGKWKTVLVAWSAAAVALAALAAPQTPTKVGAQTLEVERVDSFSPLNCAPDPALPLSKCTALVAKCAKLGVIMSWTGRGEWLALLPRKRNTTRDVDG